MNTVLVDKKDIQIAVKKIQHGEIIAFPTETVFGLGVKYGNLEYLDKLYQLKHRDANKAITLMVPEKKDIEKYAYVNENAKKVIDAFMPGMITLILKKKEDIDSRYTSGLNTIGIRIPDDPFVLQLLKKTGPMLVTSANISGKPALVTSNDVYREFNGKVSLIVEGKCIYQMASTVVKIEDEVEILRQGLITKQQIEEVLK